MLASFFIMDGCLLEELQLNQADIEVDSLDIILNALYHADHLRGLSLSKNFLTKTIC